MSYSNKIDGIQSGGVTYSTNPTLQQPRENLWQRGHRDPDVLSVPCFGAFTARGEPLKQGSHHADHPESSTFGTEELRKCILSWKAIHTGKIGMLMRT